MSTPLIVTHSCTLLHEGLRQIFKKSTFRSVRVVSTLDTETEAYIRDQESCVWLVGIEKDGPTTNDLVRRVVSASPGVKAVILASDHGPSDIVAALHAGAAGFLCQHIPADRLVKSLELIAHHQMVVYPQCHALGDHTNSHLSLPSKSEFSSDRFSAPAKAEGEAGSVVRELTRREMLILRSVMEGASNKVIALKLVMTESTVKVHMKAILRKLRVQNRTQAALWARDHADELGDAKDSLMGLAANMHLRTRAPVGEAQISSAA